MAKLASTTYGDALFELAMEEGKIREMREEAETLRQIFLENEELSHILIHPEMDKKAKIALLETIFKGKCSDGMMGFLILTVEKGRQGDILSIFEHFIRKSKEEEGIGEVMVVSAVKLPPKEKKTIEDRILSLTPYESLEITYQVDESLIGGLVIRIGDRVVDSSIRTKLQNMKWALAKIRLSESSVERRQVEKEGAKTP